MIFFVISSNLANEIRVHYVIARDELDAMKQVQDELPAPQCTKLVIIRKERLS